MVACDTADHINREVDPNLTSIFEDIGPAMHRAVIESIDDAEIGVGHGPPQIEIREQDQLLAPRR